MKLYNEFAFVNIVTIDNVLHFYCINFYYFQVLLVHEVSKGSFSRVFDLEAGDDTDPGAPRTSPYESRFPINIGITGYVATTGEVKRKLY